VGSVLGVLLLPALPANAALPPANVALDPYIGTDSQTFGTEVGNIPNTSAWDYATASPNGALAVPNGLPGVPNGLPGVVIQGALPGVIDPAVEAGAVNGGTAGSSVNYTFMANGPANAAVQILVSYNMGINTVGGGPYLQAQAIFDALTTGPNGITTGPNNATINLVLGANAPANQNLAGIISATVPSGVAQVLNLEAIVDAGGGIGQSSYAFVDPTITIAPDFASAHPGYSLEFSPNLVTVPEPATAVAGALALLLPLAAGVRRILRKGHES